MLKKFCVYASLERGAFIISFLNLLEGGAETITGIVELSQKTDDPTLFTVCLIVGLITILVGILLIYGLVTGKDSAIFKYIIARSSLLMTITIYSGMNMVQYHFLLAVFLYCLISIYFQFCIYSFYEEMRIYNTKVASGVIEVACNGGEIDNRAFDTDAV